VVCVVFLASELLPLLGDVSTETPVLGDLPGFFHCKYISPEDDKTLTYDLYFPPQFQGQEGPFPLIIFLAGYGEQKGDLRIGLAPFIRKQVKSRGRFEFVAFFPTQVGLTNAPRLLEMLDYVTSKHHIDPDRISLTGHSSGGGQVWAMANQYPDRWAAIAPVCAGGGPNVERIRHIPCWVFHGGADDLPPPETARGFVQRLRDAGGEARYTEYPGEGHLIWPKVYDTPELYRWFGEKRRR
jgi:predicted peptidase